MIGIPAGIRATHTFTIFRLKFSDDRPEELHCFSYEGGGRNDWLWSTAIQLDTVKQDLEEGVYFTFTTKSGSQYAIRHPATKIPTYPSMDHLRTWFRADSIEPITYEEWLEIVKSKEGNL